MPQPILVQAEGESAHLLRELIAGKLPPGFEAAEEIDPTRGLNVEPVTVALIAAAGTVLSSLISALAVVWKTHVEQREKKSSGAPANASTIPTLTISTHSDDIVIRIGPDAAAIALAPLPTDPADVVEIRLAVEPGARHARRS